MSKYSLFMCDKCDFTYEHVDRIFYLNEDLTEITEDTLRIITSREKTASEISGFIFVWYCIECKEFIYEYDITDQPLRYQVLYLYGTALNARNSFMNMTSQTIPAINP